MPWITQTPQVGEVPKDQGHRQLQQLDRVVPPAQD